MTFLHFTLPGTQYAHVQEQEKKKKKPSLTGEKSSRDITLGPLEGWKSTL